MATAITIVLAEGRRWLTLSPRASSAETWQLVQRRGARDAHHARSSFIRKPVTVHYPDKPRAYPDRYRGLLALVYEPDTGEEAASAAGSASSCARRRSSRSRC